ncbi:ribosomal protein S18-alanine N-acetyltransferase [Aliiruegeria lutimaris]|uniref:[Ribosomal protein bS18]-alanine N-acetyltransferase n=1 Tax=Aliiruegeria lutimaris TaxID=571298 RepID=A0A1G8XGL8_9RHOB|nr:ribosomal protein S18-alanine N-acetyltransferase [Aliiruegeria lutimaris]SDJ89779.1 ribosomal-protein-alanine N-acetyltransferase [Aliiruegeria lutimaris]
MTPAALAALHTLCFKTPRPWSEEEFAAFQQSAGVFLCARDAGFALGRIMLDEAELLTIAVDPDRQRAGHGRQLMHAYEAEARIRGATTSFLEVSAENDAARALYESCGYAQVGRRRGYYRSPDGKRIDALVFSRRLDTSSPRDGVASAAS